MPEIKCNNEKVLEILNKTVKSFPNITKPIIAYAGNDQNEFDDFLFEAGYGERPNMIISGESAFHHNTLCSHVLYINKKTLFKKFRKNSPKKTLIGYCAHELAHAELSYDVDIEISLSCALIKKAELSKSDPIRYYTYSSPFSFRPSHNEYLTDVLAIGRGYAREMFDFWSTSPPSYMNSREILAFLLSRDRLPYKIRRKGETVCANGFCVTEYCCGDIRDNKLHGLAKTTIGDTLVGRFEDGYLYKGAIIRKNGNIFFRLKEDEHLVSYAVGFYPDGSVYVGMWDVNGEKLGNGTLYGADGRIKTRGKWVNGVLLFPETPESDECIKKESKGSVYYGDLKDGTFHGIGKLTLPNEDIFVGEFENGHYSHGAYIFKKGDIYYGDFKDDKRDGYGAYYFRKGHVCIGEWKDDRRARKGKIYEPDGSIVKGGWRDQLLLYPIKTSR